MKKRLRKKSWQRRIRANNIVDVLRAENISPIELSRTANISKSTISKVLIGSRVSKKTQLHVSEAIKTISDSFLHVEPKKPWPRK